MKGPATPLTTAVTAAAAAPCGHHTPCCPYCPCCHPLPLFSATVSIAAAAFAFRFPPAVAFLLPPPAARGMGGADSPHNKT